MDEETAKRIVMAMSDPDLVAKATAIMRRIGLTDEELLALQGKSFDEFSAALDEMMKKRGKRGR